MRLPRPAVAALFVLALAACGDDDAGSPAGPTSTTAAATEDETTTSVAGDEEAPEATTTTAPSEEGPGAVESILQQLLVAPGEIGQGGFVDVGYTPTEGPNLCGVDVDADIAPSALVGTALESESQQLAVQQELRAYADPDQAAAAFAAGREGTSCATSTDGTRTLSEPTDVTGRVGGDEAFAVTVTGEGFDGLLVAVHVRDVIATFEFAGAGAGEGGQAAGALDPVEVAAFGVGKVLAYLEG